MKFFLFLPLLILFSCANEEQKVLQEVIKIIPEKRDYGYSVTGNAQGDAKFSFAEDGKTVSVEYRAIIGLDDFMNYQYSSWYEEEGQIENLHFSPSFQNPGYKYLSGDWNNGGGDNFFTLSLNPKKHEIWIVIENLSANWRYLEIIPIPQSSIKEIESLFKGDVEESNTFFGKKMGHNPEPEFSTNEAKEPSAESSATVEESPMPDSSNSYPEPVEVAPIEEVPLDEMPSEEE